MTHPSVTRLLHFAKLTATPFFFVDGWRSLYWIIVTGHYSNIIRALRLLTCSGSWCSGFRAVLQKLMPPLLFSVSKQRRHCSSAPYFVFENTAVSRFFMMRGGGLLPRLYYIHLHRSSAAPTRNAHGGGSQAMICRVRLSQRWQVRTLTQPAFKTPQQDLLLLHLLLVGIRCSTRCYFISDDSKGTFSWLLLARYARRRAFRSAFWWRSAGSPPHSAGA